MRKYKNVHAKRAARCSAYDAGYFHGRDIMSGDEYTMSACIGIAEPFANPPCKGYKCKCTEYPRK